MAWFATLCAIGWRLACIDVLNAIALTLPLTSINLLVVRRLGLEDRPEDLNVFDAVRFAPTMLNVLFGLLSDSVDPCQPCGLRSSSRQARRAHWMVIGLLGTAASIVPIALGLITSLGLLYASAVPGAVCGALTIATLEGAFVQRGRALAARCTSGVESAKERSAVQAVDYQLRGVGSLVGFVVSAAAPAHASVATVSAAVICYLVAAALAAGHRATDDDATDVAGHVALVEAQVGGGVPIAADHAQQPARRLRHASRRACVARRARRLWHRAGGRPTLVCAAAAFVFQLAPTPDDTYGSFIYSSDLDFSPVVLALASALSLAVGMVGAALLYQRLALPPCAAFTAGAASRALANTALLPITLQTGAPSTALYFAQLVVSSLFDGLAFLPLVALGALVSPAGAEATVFGLISTAQSAGSLVAASISAALCTALGVGSAGARSWERLPQFICACSAAKLVVLLLVLPLLAWVQPTLVGSKRQDGGSLGAPLVQEERPEPVS